MRISSDRTSSVIAGAAGLALAITVPGFAQEACGTCDKEIVVNEELADCFLDNFEQFAGGGNGAILVDLSVCQSRGVVEALAGPAVGGTETGLSPSVRFMLSRQQLDCLKRKLEDPAIDLDPMARIELGSCG